MKILAVIPARGGSKGVSRKNVRELAGKPLIAWTIEAAIAASGLDRVIVSTEDEEIAAISRDHGAEVPFMRPSELAEDDSTTLAVLHDTVFRLETEQGYRPDAVMTLQPTSPLRTSQHIDEAMSLFKADPNADSLVSCIEVPHIFHPRSVMKKRKDGYLWPYLDDPQPTRRQDKEVVFARNGAAIYITETACLDRFVFGGNLLAYPMSDEYSLDIDSEADFAVAEAFITQDSKSL